MSNLDYNYLLALFYISCSIIVLNTCLYAKSIHMLQSHLKPVPATFQVTPSIAENIYEKI